MPNITDILSSANVVELLDDDVVENIGITAVQEFENDLQSRSEWEERNEKALKLALQVSELKTFPFQAASNVKFPLITIAALQYHARAYPALIDGNNLVKCRVIGDDEDGQKDARAKRIETHMSYQLLEEDTDWEDEMDKALIVQPILGCAFKKTYFDPIKGYNESELVFPQDFVISYFTKSLEHSRRYTHMIQMFRNELIEKERMGIYSGNSEGEYPNKTTESLLTITRDDVQGIHNNNSNNNNTPFEILEQHCWLDLDDDGYEEPYIVTVRRDNKEVKRIVARFFESSITYTTNDRIKQLQRAKNMANGNATAMFSADKQIAQAKEDGQIASITPEIYFTKIPFIPSPDGGFYDLGFGALLGPINHAIDTMINQLIDAGTLSNTAGGFLGRGAKIKSGDTSFSPFEWKRVDSTGDDLRKSVIPLPVREPSAVLFQLLSLLINYGERIGMSVDILTGQNPGQNTPAETSRTMVEQGMKIFSGVFKRTYRALKDEFRHIYRLNQLYLPLDYEYENLTTGAGAKISQEDYLGNPTDVRPAADPNVVSDNERISKAMAVLQSARTGAGYNIYEAEKSYLEALKVSNIDRLLPDPTGPNAIKPAPDIKLQIEQLKMQERQADNQVKLRLGMIELMQEAQVNQAKIMDLQADAYLKLKQADGIDSGHELALLNSQIAIAKHHQDSLFKSIDIIKQIMGKENASNDATGMGRMETTSNNAESS